MHSEENTFFKNQEIIGSLIFNSGQGNQNLRIYFSTLFF